MTLDVLSEGYLFRFLPDGTYFEIRDDSGEVAYESTWTVVNGKVQFSDDNNTVVFHDCLPKVQEAYEQMIARMVIDG